MIIFFYVVLGAAIMWKIDSVPLAVFMGSVIITVSLDGLEDAVKAIAERK